RDEEPGSRKRWLIMLGLRKVRRPRTSDEVADDLAKIGPSAVPELIRALEDSDHGMRTTVGLALKKLGRARTVAPLIAALEHEGIPVRAGAAWALGALGDAREVEPLIAALKDVHYSVRSSAASALGTLEDPRAVKPLIAALNDEYKWVRRHAASALGELGDRRGVEPLIEALKDEEASVRGDVARALGHLGDARGVEPVIAALKDKDEQGRYLAEMGGAFGKDAFGHTQLGGAADALRSIIEQGIGVKCRAQKPGTMQRSAMHYASGTDAAEAYMVGSAAVAAATEGVTRKMVSLVREDGDGQYRCTTGLVDLADVANAEKPMPREFLNDAGNGVTEAFCDYARPLIAGDAELEVGADGLPVYARLARHMVEKKTGREYPV
ncbi:hypothetical protein LCGC14_1757080, partial [marine sediment metagenome]